MSERGSFVTEYIWCEKCFEIVRAEMSKCEEITCMVNDLPIIAGKITGGQYGNEELVITLDLFWDSAPCHPVRIAVITDTHGSGILLVQPGGEVEILAWSNREDEKAKGIGV